MSKSRRKEGTQGETLAAYLPVADAAEIRLRARVAQTSISEEITKAVRYWLTEDRNRDGGSDAT